MQYLTKHALYQKVEQIRPQLPCIPKTLRDYLTQLHQLYPQLNIIQQPLDSKKVSGMLLRGENSLILLNSSRNETSQRFTLTHEMIHYLLHQEIAQFFCEDNGTASYEWQANEGAAELLVPYRSFLPIAARLYPSLYIDRERALQTLAKQFGVSATVISFRLDSLSFELEQYRGGVALDEIRLISRKRLFLSQKTTRFPTHSHPPTLDIFSE